MNELSNVIIPKFKVGDRCKVVVLDDWFSERYRETLWKIITIEKVTNINSDEDRIVYHSKEFKDKRTNQFFQYELELYGDRNPTKDLINHLLNIWMKKQM